MSTLSQVHGCLLLPALLLCRLQDEALQGDRLHLHRLLLLHRQLRNVVQTALLHGSLYLLLSQCSCLVRSLVQSLHLADHVAEVPSGGGLLKELAHLHPCVDLDRGRLFLLWGIDTA